MDVFVMPEVSVEGEVFDCVILAVDRQSGYILAAPGKTSKKKDKRDKHGVRLQAKTVPQAMIRHGSMVFDVRAVICSDRHVTCWRMVSHDVPVYGREACQYGGTSQLLERNSRGGGQAIVSSITAIAY